VRSIVVWCERLYLFSETREAAGWVKNIRRNPNVTIRIGEWHEGATARVLDRHTDRKLWDQVPAIALQKYGWGDGLPMEITRFPHALPIPNQEWITMETAATILHADLDAFYASVEQLPALHCAAGLSRSAAVSGLLHPTKPKRSEFGAGWQDGERANSARS
jgi:hypothetical protein